MFHSSIIESKLFVPLAACSIKGYENTAMKLLSEKLNKQNANLAISEFKNFCESRDKEYCLNTFDIELVKKITNDAPILLLDEVMSELDSGRRDALLDKIKGLQTIITCTGYDDFINQRINVDKIYKIKEGKVV